jgi:hypothetical protein
MFVAFEIAMLASSTYLDLWLVKVLCGVAYEAACDASDATFCV